MSNDATEWVSERAIEDKTVVVSVEDTALLGLSSDPLYQSLRSDNRLLSEQRTHASDKRAIFMKPQGVLQSHHHTPSVPHTPRTAAGTGE